MSNKKITRDGSGYVEKLGDGTTRTVVATPAGPRVNRSRGGETWPEDPRTLGIESVAGSRVGGDNPRVTTRLAGGEAVDLTRRDGGSHDERAHHGGDTRPM